MVYIDKNSCETIDGSSQHNLGHSYSYKLDFS